MLANAAAAAGATVVFAHVNHALRPSAWQDEAVVLALGAACQVRVVAVSLEPGAAAEARLRDERYAALAQIANQVGANRIFTAHHAADQTESVLLALFRGAGPAGLTGMPVARELAPGVELVRPLLDVEPVALRAYCAALHLPFALDPTNEDRAYRRNALRATLDELRNDFPHLDAAVARCARILREERAGEPAALLRDRLRAELATVDGDARDVTFERLDSAARALERGRRGRHFLRRGLELVVE
jgi:tRNA(Ile)-lysidine synthase